MTTHVFLQKFNLGVLVSTCFALKMLFYHCVTIVDFLHMVMDFDYDNNPLSTCFAR